MQHFELEASLLDHALTKYLKATKQIDEENIPKNVTNVKGFILRIIYRHQSCTVKNILQGSFIISLCNNNRSQSLRRRRADHPLSK